MPESVAEAQQLPPSTPQVPPLPPPSPRLVIKQQQIRLLLLSLPLTNMLDRLPRELLDQVLDELPPFPDHSFERTDTLVACCLVSKRSKDSAEALLWRDVRLANSSGLATFARLLEEGVATSKAATRNLVVDDMAMRDESAVSCLHKGLRNLSSLRELRLENSGEPLDLRVLQSALPHLSSLFLGSAKLDSFDVPLPFPPLKCLSLHNVSYSRSLAPTLFSSATFPSLHTLSFTAAGASNGHTLDRALATEFDKAFLDRLELVQVHAEDFALLTPAFFHTSTAVLITVTYYGIIDFNSPFPHHLRYSRRYAKQADPSEALVPLVHHVQRFRPLSVHLPHSFLSIVPANAANAALYHGVEDLRTLCRQQHIELMCFDEEAEEEYAVSPSFWRHVKRMKAEEAGSAAGSAVASAARRQGTAGSG